MVFEFGANALSGCSFASFELETLCLYVRTIFRVTKFFKRGPDSCGGVTVGMAFSWEIQQIIWLKKYVKNETI